MSQYGGGRSGNVLRWVVLGVVILVVLWFAFSFILFVTSPMRAFEYRPFFTPFFFPFGLLFGIFLIFIFFGALRWLFWPWGWGYRRGYWGHYDDPYYLVRARYARGEITKEQFEQIMQDLQKQPHP